MPKIKSTKSAIDALPIPKGDERVMYWDTELKGFGLRVSRTNKTYYAKKHNGWVKLGEHGPFTPETARKEALKTLAALNQGVDINKQKAQARVKGITLAQALDDYFTSKPQLREGTRKTYACLLNTWLSDWMNTPLETKSKADVAKRHLKIADERGEVTANNVMRTFRAIYNHAQAVSDDSLPPNPVRILGSSRQWFRVDRRQTVIKEHELKTWWGALASLGNPVAKDALALLILSGCREQEILGLSWSEVDMQAKTITIPGDRTKNHRAHTLPMTDKILEILNNRLALRENEWVFPGAGKSGHIVDLHRAVEKVSKASGVDFCIHDLRRTFSTLADQLCTRAEVDRLTNHINPGDMTGGYIIYPVEELRAPMQRITDRIMKAVHGEETRGKVISLRRS